MPFKLFETKKKLIWNKFGLILKRVLIVCVLVQTVECVAGLFEKNVVGKSVNKLINKLLAFVNYLYLNWEKKFPAAVPSTGGGHFSYVLCGFMKYSMEKEKRRQYIVVCLICIAGNIYIWINMFLCVNKTHTLQCDRLTESVCCDQRADVFCSNRV